MAVRVQCRGARPFGDGRGRSGRPAAAAFRRRRYRWGRPGRTVAALVLVTGVILGVAWGGGLWPARAVASDEGAAKPPVQKVARHPGGADPAARAGRSPQASTTNGDGAGEAALLQGNQVVIRRGDRIWAIVERYGRSDRDPRDLVAAVMEANGLTSPALRPGMVLVLPPEVLR